MTDLSHWAYTSSFSGADTAALILGIDPSDPSADLSRTRPVLAGMQRAHISALCSTHSDGLESNWVRARRRDGKLETSILSSESRFEAQLFSKVEIARWLADNGMASVYPFDSKPTVVEAQDGIDPADFPEELHAANIAFRAIHNGYGERTATVKNRLVDYLERHFPDLNNEAVQRIATVANPNKVRGRKKLSPE